MNCVLLNNEVVYYVYNYNNIYFLL